MTFEEIAERARSLFDPAPCHTGALTNDILVLIAELAEAMQRQQ
jgi:hypothetical protein